MYQISDIYKPDLTRKPTLTATNVHILHQRRDQTTGVEQKKSLIRKKKRAIVARINTNMTNRRIAELAQNFLKANEPVKYGENSAKSSLA